MKTFALASLIAALPATLAVPDVTARELPAGCASLPQYKAETGNAGPWTVQVVESENAAIEGFSDTSRYSVSYNPAVDRQPTLRWGAITIPTRNDIAKNPLQCVNGKLTALVVTELTAAGAPTNYQWTPLVFSPYPYDAELMYKIEAGLPVSAFEHYIGDEKQAGVYLGGYNGSTTWGFKYWPASLGTFNRDYFSMRLLPEGQALQANETRGFIKIVE